MDTLMELLPLSTQRQRSFYGKAIVVNKSNGDQILLSYLTPVAKRNGNGRITRLWSGWTATTGKHILAFTGMNKSEFCRLPVAPLNEPVRLFIEATPR